MLVGEQTITEGAVVESADAFFTAYRDQFRELIRDQPQEIRDSIDEVTSITHGLLSTLFNWMAREGYEVSTDHAIEAFEAVLQEFTPRH